jgi:hypothetical protein
MDGRRTLPLAAGRSDAYWPRPNQVAEGERGMLPEGWDPASGRLCSPATDVCANLNASASEASERTSTDYELIAT